jgi:predicted amidohydrolase
LNTASDSKTLKIALGEYDIGWQDPSTSLDRASSVVAEAVAGGAQLVVLPEMCTTGFTMDVSLAEPIGGSSVARLAKIARDNSVWLIAGVATRDSVDVPAHNSALVFRPTGELEAVYRKQRLFAYADEQRSYTGGDAPLVVEIEGVRVSPFICYDLRFPELFREVAARADVMIVIASWPEARRPHWDAMLRVRAIENLCYFIGVNRVGQGGSLTYNGGSAAYDPWGETIVSPDRQAHFGIAIASVSAGEVERTRSTYPFLADRH